MSDPDLDYLADDATVEEVEATIESLLGCSLRDALGPAYGDLEQMILESVILNIDHPEHQEIARKLQAQYGEERAAELAVGMALLVKAQGRAYMARRGDGRETVRTEED